MRLGSALMNGSSRLYSMQRFASPLNSRLVYDVTTPLHGPSTVCHGSVIDHQTDVNVIYLSIWRPPSWRCNSPFSSVLLPSVKMSVYPSNRRCRCPSSSSHKGGRHGGCAWRQLWWGQE